MSYRDVTFSIADFQYISVSLFCTKTKKTIFIKKYVLGQTDTMATNKWKIDSGDAVWYQIRRCLTEHNLATNEQLATKILSQIEEFGFLDRDEVYDYIKLMYIEKQDIPG
jgi:hypothetical protein